MALVAAEMVVDLSVPHTFLAPFSDTHVLEGDGLTGLSGWRVCLLAGLGFISHGTTVQFLNNTAVQSKLL